MYIRFWKVSFQVTLQQIYLKNEVNNLMYYGCTGKLYYYWLIVV